MIKVSVLYPNNTNIKFDMHYYLARHIPMVKQKLGSACKKVAVEEGIAGGASGASATYFAMAHLAFDSVDTLKSRVWSARRSDHGRHPELHQCATGRADQRSENATLARI
jgi:uncharacterized protein (TIGR02118 family)